MPGGGGERGPWVNGVTLCWSGGENVTAPVVVGPGDGCLFVAVFRGSDIVRGALDVENCACCCCCAAVFETDVLDQTVCAVEDVEDDVIVGAALGMAELCARKAARKFERNGRFDDISEGVVKCMKVGAAADAVRICPWKGICVSSRLLLL